MTVPKYLILLLTVLFFSCGNKTTETNSHYTDKPVDTIKQLPYSQTADTALFKVWSAFQEAVSTNNVSQFRHLSLDSLYSCDTILSTSKFINKCYNEVFDTLLLRKIVIPKEVNQTDITMELGYFSKHVLEIAVYTGDIITLKQFQIVKEVMPDDSAWTITFDFIRTKNGYRFFGCGSYGGPICCL